MAVKFLAGIDLSKNELQNARIQNLASDPSSPVEGQIYYNTTSNVLKYYDDAGWETLSSGSGTVTSVGGTGTVNGLTLTGTVTSSGNLTLGGTLSISNADWSGADLALTNGGTGASNASDARSNLGIGSIGVLNSIATGNISDDAVTYAKIQNVSATNRILGRDSAGAGVIEEISPSALRTMINVADGATANAGTVTSVSGGNGLTGSVTSSGSLAVGAGTGITVNANDVAITAAQTGITSVLNAALKVGRDADNDIDFSTDNQIIFRANGADQIKIQDGAIVPVTDNDVDLGTSSKEFKNAYFDGTVTADSFSGPLTGTASQVTVSANSDNTAFAMVFDNSNSLLKDGNASDTITYNPSTQTLTVKNITVAGTQTINNTQLINTANGVVFEGATADAFETSLVATDPTADRTITLPDFSGHVAIFGSSGNGKITATSTELNYVSGVTSAIQTQLNGKQASVTGGATTILSSNLTASRALVSNGSGKVAVSAVTSTELGYLDGVTSAIQTQLNAKGTMTSFQLEDGDGTEVTIGNGKEVKFVEGGNIDINWTDVSNGSDSDPYDLTFTVPNASTSARGAVELATNNEASAGTDTSRAVTAAGVKQAIDARSFQGLIGDGTATTYTVTHSLSSRDVIVQLYDASSYETVYADVVRTTTDAITVTFGSAPANDDIKVLVTKCV